MRTAAGGVLADGDVIVRPIRVRDAIALERELAINRRWLRPWEATVPGGGGPVDVRSGIRALLRHARTGASLPFALEVDGELAGQLNVSSITAGSLSSATIGYWVSERFAGREVTPTAVALVSDLLFIGMGVHRVEICIRPENRPSVRVVEKLGFRYEGLRRRYIHIDGDWRDHFAFALTVEDVPVGVFRRWKEGQVRPAASRVNDVDWAAAGLPTRSSAGAPSRLEGSAPLP